MLKKLIGLVTASLMAIVGLVSMPIAIAPAQAAPPASAFDPGLIISDSVFFDFGSMTVTTFSNFWTPGSLPAGQPTLPLIV